MIKKILQIPLYPFLIALAPVVNLFIINRLNLGAFDLVRPVAVHLIFASAAVALSRLVCRSNRGAGLVGSILILSAVTYGFGFHLAVDPSRVEEQSTPFLIAWLVGTGVLCLALVFFLRRMRGSLRDITMVFNSFSVVILLAVMAPLMSPDPAPLLVEKTDKSAVHEWFQITDSASDAGNLPDVYFIVLDAYARGDVLQTRFDFDNSEFLQWLVNRGFFIGHRSHSNYAWTHLSLSSTLNGEYLDTLVPGSIQENAPGDYQLRYLFTKWALATDYVKASRVHRFFDNLGYRIISNDTGYAITRYEPTSLVRSLTGPTNQFEEMLITHSLAQPLISIFQNTELVQKLEISRHDQVIGTLEELAEAAGEDGPKFVFFHIVSPHGPFGFNAQGGPNPPHPLYDASPWIHDKFKVAGYADWYRDTYPLNLAGLNVHLRTTFDSIMETTDGTAIVIIQSDHGTHSGFDIESAANTDVLERFGILNAVYLPEHISRDGLSGTMSSVNTFRVVLSNTFGLDLPLLEDRAFYSAGDLDFEEVTDRLRE